MTRPCRLLNSMNGRTAPVVEFRATMGRCKPLNSMHAAQADWWHLDGADTCSLFSTWMARLLEEHKHDGGNLAGGHAAASSTPAPVTRKRKQSDTLRTSADQDPQSRADTEARECGKRKLLAVTQHLHPAAPPGGSSDKEWKDLHDSLPEEVQALMRAVAEKYGDRGGELRGPGNSDINTRHTHTRTHTHTHTHNTHKHTHSLTHSFNHAPTYQFWHAHCPLPPLLCTRARVPIKAT